MEHKQSKHLFEEAKKYIPGGVNSPVRAFKSVGLDPIFIERAEGSQVYDVDGNAYIDYICSWGPIILGHGHKDLLEGMDEVIERGTSYGVPTSIEVDMARLIVEAYPSVDLVRMVNSGTEATMSALRVARAYTNRNKIVKFEGCYHGHSDALLVKSGSGTLTFGIPTSPGVPAKVVEDTLICRYNDLASVETMFKEHGEDIAAIIVEPVAGNMGVVPPEQSFLEGLREIASGYDTVLIFDEVITGFRLAYGGAQDVFGVVPDMTCFGKIIGGGLPVGAYGGKKEIMNRVSPLGDVYQAGTLSGNPLAMHMGYKNLTKLKEHPEVYIGLEEKAKKLERGFKDNIEKLGVAATVNRIKGMICLFFASGPMRNYDDVSKCDTDKYARFFKEMLNRGILLPPAQFEGIFLSHAHSDDDIDRTIEGCYEALKIAYDI